MINPKLPAINFRFQSKSTDYETKLDGATNYLDAVAAPNLAGSDLLHRSSLLASSVFRSTSQKEWTPPKTFITQLSNEITIIEQATSYARPSQALIEKIKNVALSLVQARGRLEELPDSPVIAEGIKKIGEALERLPIKYMALLNQNLPENVLHSLQAMQEVTSLFGENDYRVMKKFLLADGAAEIVIDAIELSRAIKSENIANLTASTIPNNITHTNAWAAIISRATAVLAETSFENKEQREIIAIFNTLFGLAMPSNTQINSDGFLLGIVRQNEEAGDTSPLGRALERRTDPAGYSQRSSYLLRNRDLWIDVSPANILQEDTPFVSGTRQLSFKLNNGARREASVPLDLSSLGKLTYQQSCAALSFIRDAERVYIEPLSEKESEGRSPYTEKLEVLVKNASGLELFSNDQIKNLIGIAVDFNTKLTLNIHHALYDLSPDIRDSCLDNLKHLYQDHWKTHEEAFEKLLATPQGLQFVHGFLQLYDKMQFLLCFHGRDWEETSEKVSALYQEAKEMLDNSLLEEKTALVKLLAKANNTFFESPTISHHYEIKLDGAAIFFETIATSGLTSSNIFHRSASFAANLFRTKGKPPKHFITQLSSAIAILQQAADCDRPTQALAEKIQMGTQSLVEAHRRLEELPQHSVITQGIVKIDTFLKGMKLEKDRKIENLINEMFHLFIGQDSIEIDDSIEVDGDDIQIDDDKTMQYFRLKMKDFLALDGAIEFIEECLSNLDKYRKLNEAHLKLGKLTEIGEQTLIAAMLPVKVADIAGQDTLLNNMILNLMSLAVPTNLQIFTDGFCLGLFNPSVLSDREAIKNTLLLKSTPYQRTLNSVKDDLGYQNRAGNKLIKQRDCWLKLTPPNLVGGGQPFISGTRQICFKLPNGARTESRSYLDLSSLGEMDLEMNRRVLSFIVTFCAGNSEREIFAEAQGELGKTTLRELEKLVENHFPKDKTPLLIGIAMAFNKQATVGIYQSLFAFTPDIEKSCLEQLQYIFDDHNLSHDLSTTLQEAWEKNPEILKSTKRFLDQYDKLQFLQTKGDLDDERIAQEKLRLMEMANQADGLLNNSVLFQGIVETLPKLRVIDSNQL